MPDPLSLAFAGTALLTGGGLGGWLLGRRSARLAYHNALSRLEALRASYDTLFAKHRKLRREAEERAADDAERARQRSETVRKGHIQRRANRAAKKAGAR